MRAAGRATGAWPRRGPLFAGRGEQPTHICVGVTFYGPLPARYGPVTAVLMLLMPCPVQYLLMLWVPALAACHGSQ